MLKVSCLTNHFLTTNHGLKEALHDKNRGYGIVTIELNGLTFGIPLRTNLNHKYGIHLDSITKNGKTSKRGLDFTKAVLVRDAVKDIGGPFFVSEDQKKVLTSRKKMIVNQFEKYVEQYVNAVKGNVSGTLSSPAYRYSTLINYHDELGL